MKNKWLIIGIAVAVIVVGMLACNGRGDGVSQPNVPAAPASGAIDIAAKKLISDVRNNPYKYNPGTIFRVSGIVERVVSQGGSGYTLYIGPKVKENVILVQFFRTSINADQEKQFSALGKLRGGEQIVVQGSYIGLIGEFVSLQNPSLVSIKK